MEHRLTLPLSDDDIRGIHAGDTVYLTGKILTARDAAHRRIVKLLDEGAPLPFELAGSAVYYAGPCPAPPGLPIGSCGPTTSSRMDGYAPRLIALGQKVMIGKGPRSRAVRAAVGEHGGLYLAATGGAGALYARCVRAARVVAFEDLGPEAVRELEVADMPLVAAVDCHGGNLYETGLLAYQTEDIIIKNLTLSDAEPAMALYRRVVASMHAAGFMQWNDAYPNIGCIRRDTGAGAAWGAWLCGRLAAVATVDGNQSEEYGPIPFEFGEPYRVVHRLAVDPDFQRRGLAARMMDFAEGLARAAGCPAMRLDTCEDNAAALALYENRGYVRRGTCRFPGRTYTFIVMEKKL